MNDSQTIMDAIRFLRWRQSVRERGPGPLADTTTFVGSCLCGGLIVETADGGVFDWRHTLGDPRRRHECASHLAKEMAKGMAERAEDGPPATATPTATKSTDVAVPATRSRSGIQL